MAVEVALDSPLAEKLQGAVQAKVADAGWSGIDDTGLAEYIVLMLVNGKNQSQVVSELSTDLLDLPANDPAVNNFSQWLFEYISNQAKPETQQNPTAAKTEGAQDQDTAMSVDGAGDASNQDEAQSQIGTVPTGPKSMRENPMRGRGDKRGAGMAGRMGRTPDAGMHRIKGASNRINTHASPRGSARGGRGNMRGNINQGRMNNALQSQLDSLSGGQMGMGGITPEAMQLLAMQQQMFSQFMTPDQQQAFLSSMGGGMMPPQGGFAPPHRSNGHIKRSNGGDSDAMDVSSANNENGEGRLDTSTTMCRYNLFCTKPDCHFVHQSPAAPPDVAIDMNDSCQFGASCTNKKCAGRHPSPANRSNQQSTSAAMCRYWPNCTNPNCTFAHPTSRLCRNGADCTTEGCKFTHPTVECKFNPCLNPQCTFKHAAGQKRGKFQDKVWVNPESNENNVSSMSERKFTDENAPVEVIVPGQGRGDGGGGGGEGKEENQEDMIT